MNQKQLPSPVLLSFGKLVNVLMQSFDCWADNAGITNIVRKLVNHIY